MLLLLQADPTGMSTPLGKIAVAAMLLAVIVVLVRFLWQNRGK